MIGLQQDFSQNKDPLSVVNSVEIRVAKIAFQTKQVFVGQCGKFR